MPIRRWIIPMKIIFNLFTGRMAGIGRLHGHRSGRTSDDDDQRIDGFSAISWRDATKRRAHGHVSLPAQKSSRSDSVQRGSRESRWVSSFGHMNKCDLWRLEIKIAACLNNFSREAELRREGVRRVHHQRQHGASQVSNTQLRHRFHRGVVVGSRWKRQHLPERKYRWMLLKILLRGWTVRIITTYWKYHTSYVHVQTYCRW